MRNGGNTTMQIQIWFTPAVPRSTVFIHAWDQNGGVWDLAGTLAANGVTWGFALSGTTQDQRDVSFKYRFANNVWEPDTFTRTVPCAGEGGTWRRRRRALAYSGGRGGRQQVRVLRRGAQTANVLPISASRRPDLCASSDSRLACRKHRSREAGHCGYGSI